VRSILFFIPVELAGQPVLGFGWLLWIWLVVSVVTLILVWRQPGGKLRQVLNSLPLLLVAAALIVVVLPWLIERDASGRPLGIPVRGFGVSLMLAVSASLALARYRAVQMGVNPDHIIGLATVMIAAGLVGARLAFVIQYWQEFHRETFLGTLQALTSFTKGGLVVYGSVIAGVPAGIWYLRRHALPGLAIGDIIAPSMALGLAIGRIGCFFNGCCFGGACLPPDWRAMSFPADSPPYKHQLDAGWKSGIWVRKQDGQIYVAHVAPQSPAAASGLEVGDRIASINGTAVESLSVARRRLAKSSSYKVQTADKLIHRWTDPTGPARSVPIHPTQLYAALDAGFLALVLWFAYPYRRRDGEIFALLVTLHPLSRFVLEIIRTDEPGQFGTSLTISQWMSLGILGLAILLWWYIEYLSPHRAPPNVVQAER
jgi:phosphatidylglycerol---prolipoprotein diacylglyceryl transferase